ncbi:SRPBCC family protein [Nitrosococcus watsonii]|uniref:Polyketide cyclase/dehydrase n=1 Tax=Nitrosococcus watsoni (strain C-113) TaxID=105559 RepID=D8K4I7_NITWC|nr:SRPBCC family protein [Nitrosococcus watsonii]ADJ27884.1 Polyketide cyclase/dehydrase [Nitrosococcus watsonii C-113]
MIKVQSSILIDCPVDDAFQYVSAGFFENYPKWSPEVVELEKITNGPVRMGTMARQVRIDKGRRTESIFQVTEHQPPWQIEFGSLSSPRYQARYNLEPVAAEKTHIRFTFELRLEFFMRPFENVIASAVKAGSQNVVCNLKQLLEAEKPTQSMTALVF